MHYKIKDLKYIRRDCVFSKYIVDHADYKIANELVKGLININAITEETEFEFVDSFFYSPEDKMIFMVLKCDLGMFVTRCDNCKIVEKPEDILKAYGFKRIIRQGDKTILIDSDNNKFITTRDKSDKDDIEKAVMILLLKANGFNIKDVYDIISTVK